MAEMLEIHHIDVGGGDATAITVKDNMGNITAKVLIDAGAEGSGSESLENYITNCLEPTIPFDYIIASHYHNDHMDGFRQRKIQFKKYLDIGGYTIGTDVFVPVNGKGFSSAPGFFSGYTQLIAKNIKDNAAVRTKIPFIEKGFSGVAAPLVLTLDVGVTLTCYCANGVLADGTNVLLEQKRTKGRAFNPNDLSLAFMVEWESFCYFTAGDLSGDPLLGSYYNVEQKLVDYLVNTIKKTPTAMKVNHHGSEYSSYAGSASNGFLDRMQPDTLVVPCNISKNVPSPSFLKRAYTYCAAKKAAIVFLNDVDYTSADDQYAQLVQIQGNADLDCNIVLNTTDKKAANDARAIVIRRLVGGKKDDSMLEGSDTRIFRKDYAIIVRTGKFARSGGKISRSSGYKLSSSFDTALLDSTIIPGFQEQADAIASWIQEDQTKGSKDGSDYVEQNFPDLSSIIASEPIATLPNKLVERMKELFNNVYLSQTLIDRSTIYSPNNPQYNDLSLDEQKTIFLLLRRNKYQLQFNLAIELASTAPARRKIERELWNTDDEPYAPSGAEKRVGSDLIPEDRTKKSKGDGE